MGQFDETVDETGVNLTPTPGLDPFSAMVTPAMLGSGPQAPPMPPVQMPTPPQAPAPPGNMQRIISMALLGLAAGLGPRHAGGGVAQGLMQGQQSNDQERKLQFQQQQLQYHEQQQEAIRQQALQLTAQRAQQQEQDKRQAALQQALMTIRTEVKTIPDKATYDTRVDGYANLLKASGYRIDANWLRQAVPYVAPSAKQTAQDAVTTLFKNPLYQQQLKENPAALASGSMMIDLNGDGVKEKRTIQEVMDAAGMTTLVDDSGKPIALASSTEGPIANQALKAKIAKFRAENRREPDAKEMDALVTEARTPVKDPEMAGIAKELALQRLENAKKPKDESLMSITETDPDTGEQVTSLVPRKAGEVSRKPPKEPNQAQFQAGAYAGRMEQSGQILDQLEKDVSGMNLASFAVQSRLPSAAQSGTYQSYDQAARNFVNALLRRESGAAISQSEFDNARKQYIPQPGDTQQTLKQKKANRDYVFQTMKTAAGPRGYQPPITVDPATSAREKLKNR